MCNRRGCAKYLRKALFVSSYALKLKKAVRVSDGTTKCSIDTSLYAVYFNNVFDGSRTSGIGSLSGSAQMLDDCWLSKITKNIQLMMDFSIILSHFLIDILFNFLLWSCLVCVPPSVVFVAGVVCGCLEKLFESGHPKNLIYFVERVPANCCFTRSATNFLNKFRT